MNKGKSTNLGRVMAIIVIIALIGNEAVAYLLNRSYNPDQLASQYFRLTLTAPILVFFYLGFSWAVWLMRIALVLGIFTTVVLAIMLSELGQNHYIIGVSIISVFLNLFGAWIVFASASFKSYILAKKRARGQYD
jgi:hypothetical protein